MSNPFQEIYDAAVQQKAKELYIEDWQNIDAELKKQYFDLAHIRVREELAEAGMV